MNSPTSTASLKLPSDVLAAMTVATKVCFSTTAALGTAFRVRAATAVTEPRVAGRASCRCDFAVEVGAVKISRLVKTVREILVVD